MLSLEALGEDPSLPLTNFWWLPTVLGVPWFIYVSQQSLSLWSSGLFPTFLCLDVNSLFPMFSYHFHSVHLSVFKFPSYRNTSHWIRTLILTEFNLVIFQRPNFQIRFPVDENFGGILFSPAHQLNVSVLHGSVLTHLPTIYPFLWQSPPLPYIQLDSCLLNSIF